MDGSGQVRCVDCAHANMRGSKTWAAFGCCTCNLGKPYHFLPLRRPRECALFAPAPPGVADKRITWLQANTR